MAQLWKQIIQAQSPQGRLKQQITRLFLTYSREIRQGSYSKHNVVFSSRGVTALSICILLCFSVFRIIPLKMSTLVPIFVHIGLRGPIWEPHGPI